MISRWIYVISQTVISSSAWYCYFCAIQKVEYAVVKTHSFHMHAGISTLCRVNAFLLVSTQMRTWLCQHQPEVVKQSFLSFAFWGFFQDSSLRMGGLNLQMELSKHIKAYDSWLHHVQWSAGVPLSLIPSVILSLQEIIRGNRGKDLCDSLLFSQHQIQRKAEVSEKKSARIDLHEVSNFHADCSFNPNHAETESSWPHQVHANPLLQ